MHPSANSYTFLFFFNFINVSVAKSSVIRSEHYKLSISLVEPSLIVDK